MTTQTSPPGQRAIIAESVREMRRMRAELEALELERTEPLAIVGMSCRMPGGANDPDAFWSFLRDGGDGIGDIPGSRWDTDRFYDPSPDAAGTMYTRRGGFLRDIDQFDAAFFGISPREAASLDPQQRLLLEAAWEALEHAGQSPDELTGTATGVFIGVTNSDYCQLQMQQIDPADLQAYCLTSSASTFAAGRLSYWLGLAGPSLSVDTACSSSLVALHLACQSLRAGDCSTALAAGVNVLLSPEWFVVLSRARMLAADGRCKTFDKSADGYVRSEGCGVVVLKRLSDAVAHGDRVLALIRGSAVNQDGRSSGITVPNAAAQQDVVRRALRAAAVAPAAISYVEAHGTGTPVGDPIELRALAAALRPRVDGAPLLVGSVKTNIGHLEPAAGIAGLIKVVLSLQNEQIPRHLHFDEINPDVALEDGRVAIPTATTPWPRQAEPRLAGVSSFGASGTNAHVILEEAPLQDVRRAPTDGPPNVLTLSAKSADALRTLAERYVEQLGRPDGAAGADVCFTSNLGRAHLPHRAAVVGASASELRERLSALVGGDDPSAGSLGRAPAGARPKVAFLFTGQGSQYAAMARGLYDAQPSVRAIVDAADERLGAVLGRSLLSILVPAPGDESLVHETRYAQPALFTLEYAVAQLWRSWGVEPAAVLGHSVGELAAACVAGALDFDSGLMLAAKRGLLMHELCAEGAMAAVFATPQRVAEALTPFAAEASMAAINGPENVVVSGSADAVRALLATLTDAGVSSKPIAVTRAFHSPLIEPMMDGFEAYARGLDFTAPGIPLISNVTGQPLEGALSAGYLREHVRAPVQFWAGVQTLLQQGYRTFVEVGPAPTLSSMAKRATAQHGDGAELAFLPSLRPRHDDRTVLMASLGALYVRGFEIDWRRLHDGPSRRRVALPSYPFQRRRHWFDPSARAAAPDPPGRPAPASLLGRRVPSPLPAIQFESELRAERHPCLADCVMDGLSVVNIGFYLEAAIAAAGELEGPGPLLIEDCLVLQRLVLEQGGATTDVHLVLEPEAGDRFSYGYYAAPRADPGPPRWLLHARGTVGPDPAPTAAGERGPDLAATRRQLGEGVDGSTFYRDLWRRKLYLGPAARWIEQIWPGAGEAVARMRAALPDEAAAYALPPGLTDAMFQVLFGCLPAAGPADAVYMLVGIDRFSFCAYDRGAPSLCRARLLPGSDPESILIADVGLYAEDGAPVARAQGAYLKRVQPAALQPATTAGDALPPNGRRQPDRPANGRPAAPGTAPAARANGAGAATRTPEQVSQLVVETVARALGASADELDRDETLQNLGLDSLMALEVKDTLTRALGIALPLVAFLDRRSAAGLADVVSSMLPGAAGEGAQAGPAPAVPATVDGGPLRPDPGARHDPFELTDLQQAYLVGRMGAFELGNISTYFLLEVELEDLDLQRLAAAWQAMIARHDMLRAVVTADGYQRVLREVPAYEIRTVDLTGCDASERGRRLDAIHAAMRDQVLDPATWPLFDVRATRIDERRTRLHVGLDALIIDAWSTSLLFREWAAAYRGEAPPAPDLSLTFRDYVVAVRSLEGGPAHERALQYWRGRIDTLPPAPELPVAIDPATLTTPTFVHRSSRLDADAWARFKRTAASAGVTASAALCTAYAQVLAAWSKSSHFTLNVLFFNRLALHPEVGSVLGNFSATTLLEVRSSATTTFAARAEQVQKQLWTDLEHSDVTGVRMLRELNRARGNATRAAMPVVFASTVNFASREDSAATTGPAQHLTGIGASGREISSSIRTPQVWLDHQVVEERGELVVNWDVIEEIFPPGLIDAMFSAYVELLRELSDDEQAWQRPAGAMLPAADLPARLAANATAGPVPDGLLHEPFVARAAAWPQRVAVIAGERTLTFGELDAESNRLDHWLRGRGVAPGALVAIVMDKGWEQVVACLGILKSGAAYVPIDAAVPAEHLQRLLQIADVSVVLTQSRVEARTSWPPGTQVLSVDGPQERAQSTQPLAAAGTAGQDLAYVIFTSGSTGLPKGVMIEHASALNTVADVSERFGLTADDRVLALSALSFDLSVFDIFGPLSVGGAVVIPEPGAHREPARWLELVAEHRVTVWNSVPTLMDMFTEHALARGVELDLALRLVMLSGDWIAVTLPDRIRTLLPGVDLWSLGGATEASIWSIRFPIEDVDPQWSSIPYGTPMRNQSWHVLDDALRACPTWSVGDLFIGGLGLARGYLGDEVRTRQSFIRHPATGERLYRTGDLGRYLPDGTIEFLGREDFQVKVQGYRVELGDIEAALRRCRGVRSAVAAAVGAQRGAKRLVAYVVLEEGRREGDADEHELDRALREKLPAYLVPQQIVVLDALPLSSNGKLDRSLLPLPGSGPAGDTAILPRDELEGRLAGIWQQFFDARPIGVTASFFDLGGDSLLAVRLMAQIHAELDRSLPLSSLFAHPTIELLARVLREGDDAVTRRRDALVPIRATGAQPPLLLVHPVGGDVLCYAELAARLDEACPVYGLQVPDVKPALPTVAELAAHYVDALERAQLTGPIRLAGWSMGAAVALEMAQQLTAAGVVVELLALVDVLQPPGAVSLDIDDAVLLSWFARDLAGLAETDWAPSPGSFRGVDAAAGLDRFCAGAHDAGVLPREIGAVALRPIFATFARNFRALLAYEPAPYGGRVRLLQGSASAAHSDTANAWMALFGGDAAVIELPGDHYSLMRPPHVGALAGALDALLSTAVGDG